MKLAEKILSMFDESATLDRIKSASAKLPASKLGDSLIFTLDVLKDIKKSNPKIENKLAKKLADAIDMLSSTMAKAGVKPTNRPFDVRT